MDKFTKGVLSIIAVGVIGINIQMMNGGSGFISKAEAGDYGADPSRNVAFNLGVKRVVEKYCAGTSEKGVYGIGSFKIDVFSLINELHSNLLPKKNKQYGCSSRF